VARNPAVAAVGARRYVVGNNIPLFDEAPIAAATLSAWEIGGRSIGAPSGHHMFVSPRVARLGDRTMMMMWGEPDSVSVHLRQDWFPQRLTQVWWAITDWRVLVEGSRT
jgi:hypothetical protein